MKDVKYKTEKIAETNVSIMVYNDWKMIVHLYAVRVSTFSILAIYVSEYVYVCDVFFVMESTFQYVTLSYW